MKISSSAVIVALSLISAEAVQQQADIYYHEKARLGPSMWNFSPDGLTIFSPNGDVLRQHRKNTLCKESVNARTGQLTDDCSYFTAASDGHEYVYAASLAGDHSVQVFDIDTGDYAGYVDTCSTPIDMEYQPVRREMYVRCAQEDTVGGAPGEIDVISSASLSTNLPMVSFNATTRPYGRLAVHSSMGPYGYSLAYDQNYVTEMDLSSKTVAATYEIPNSYGAYDTAYSPINQHLYFRARVCCSCEDIESCGRGGNNVTVRTGPSASEEPQIGVCSGGCEGSRADTIGVWEFDTVNKVFVDSHNLAEGTGWGCNPYASPDGRWIVLAGNDGGQNVRILEVGANGESSASSIRDVAMDFEGAASGQEVVSDVAFIQDETRQILIVGASTDNNIVLVDLETFETLKLDLVPDVAESTGGGSRRLEWAVGTDYVWVNGGEAEEAYILHIPGGLDSVSVDRTVGNVARGELIFVNNYERMRAAEMAQGTLNTENVVMEVQEESSAAAATDGSGDISGIVGIVLGALGLVAGLGALALVTSQKNSAAALANSGVVEGNDVEDGNKSLGSKRVN